ncbi:16464_t:CDS:2, partial [Acaulospora colombiana]
EFQLDLKPAIPKLVALFADPAMNIRWGAQNAILSSAVQTPLQYDIKATMPNIIQLFSHGSDPIRKDAVWAISRFVILGDFQSEIKDIIPKVIEMRADNFEWKPSYLTNEEAGLHSEVKASTPKVMELLTDGAEWIQRATLKVIWRFSEQGQGVATKDNTAICGQIRVSFERCEPIEAEFRPEIKTEIPKMALLFAHRSENTQVAALRAIRGLAAQIEYQPDISNTIPRALVLLNHRSETIRGVTLDMLAEFATQEVAPAIPRVIELLSDGSKW